VNSQDFEFVAQLLRKRAGIVLTGDKMYLLESRLAPLARKGPPRSTPILLRARAAERLINQVVD
jgi:chemotaxis protein methyltransferase CheR